MSRDDVFDLLNKKILVNNNISLEDLIDFLYENCSCCSTNDIRDLISRANHKLGTNYKIDDALKLWVRLKD